MPSFAIAANGNAGLGSRFRCRIARSSAARRGRVAIPLGEAAAGGRPQNKNVHVRSGGAQLGAGVAVDFRAERDLDDVRLLPGHGASPVRRNAQP